jgi:hypothetical protein
MTKKDLSILELAMKRSSRRITNKSWFDKLPSDEQQEIIQAVDVMKKENKPIICLAEVLIDKYNLDLVPESIVRTITRRSSR